MEPPKGSLDLCSTYTKWLNLDIFSLFVRSGTCWSQTCQPLWPLRSCVRRWEQRAALPSSSPSHSSGSMMKVGVPRRKILHISLCALSHLLWPFYTTATALLLYKFTSMTNNACCAMNTSSHRAKFIFMPPRQRQPGMEILCFRFVCPAVSFSWRWSQEISLNWVQMSDELIRF